jgi:hypothetical protein
MPARTGKMALRRRMRHEFCSADTYRQVTHTDRPPGSARDGAVGIVQCPVIVDVQMTCALRSPQEHTRTGTPRRTDGDGGRHTETAAPVGQSDDSCRITRHTNTHMHARIFASHARRRLRCALSKADVAPTEIAHVKAQFGLQPQCFLPAHRFQHRSATLAVDLRSNRTAADKVDMTQASRNPGGRKGGKNISPCRQMALAVRHMRNLVK